MPATIRDLVTSAYRELGIAPLVGDLPAELASLGLNTLNTFLDQWNAEHSMLFADLFSTFTLTIGLNPHTIGPTGATWTLTQRPTEILGAVVIDGDTRIPVDVTMTREEFQALGDQTVTSDYPTRIYYNPTYPNGSIYFNFDPSAAHSVELLTRRQLSSVVLNDTWSYPQGYEAAIKHTLKELLAGMPMFASASAPDVSEQARKARSVIFDNNTRTPSICTADSGLMRGGSDYDYRVGPLLS
jgi:hypothetical protein